MDRGPIMTLAAFAQLPAGDLVLASASSIRAKILHDAGLGHRCYPVSIDEESVRASASAEAVPVGDIAVMLAEMKAAAASGCVRLSTGLESGSQRILDLMKKGVVLDVISKFLQDSAAAGISNRTTMIHGYPGETASDVLASAQFVEAHTEWIERVKVCSFTVSIGTTIDRQLRKENALAPVKKAAPLRDPDLEGDTPGRPTVAKIDYRAGDTSSAAYRRATSKLLEAAHIVNCRSLPERARVFEGVM